MNNTDTNFDTYPNRHDVRIVCRTCGESKSGSLARAWAHSHSHAYRYDFDHKTAVVDAGTVTGRLRGWGPRRGETITVSTGQTEQREGLDMGRPFTIYSITL